jgi:glutathione S-transferase
MEVRMNAQPELPGAAGLGPMTLVSHALCPYVQRAAIMAHEKAIALERVVVDLADKPDWFVERSPTGKVPLMMIGDITLFESAAIAEFFDEISGGGMLPRDSIERARHRAWIEFASGTLAEIGAFYSAADSAAYDTRRGALVGRFRRVAKELTGPWFGGRTFGLVDAAFAPVFRYLDAFERDADLFLLDDEPGLSDWRERLAKRASVKAAVLPDYPERLRAFLLSRDAHISRVMRREA